jgi:hypothetical protein
MCAVATAIESGLLSMQVLVHGVQSEALLDVI